MLLYAYYEKQHLLQINRYVIKPKKDPKDIDQ